MKDTMKEVVVVEPHKVEVREVEIPELANEDEVLIQMKSAGVCGSDHHIYHGLNPCSTYPRIPGHENAGIVKKIGKNVTNVKVGDHVIVDLISTCGECYQCKIGRKNVCEHVKVRGSGADGGWREYFTAPANEVYKINESVKWEDAALVEPYAIGAHSTTRGRVVPEDVVFILGTGTIGSIILQTCKAKGCKTVICCDIDDSSLERAKGYGADYVINSKTAVTQLTKSLAVDCAGRNININAIAPGYMDTEMCANMTQARKDETTARIPAGRWGTPDDLKGPVLFLASSASDYLNGAVIPVDGAYLVK